MLDTLQWATLLLFLVTSMAGIGLQVRMQDLHAMIQRKGLLLCSLLVNFIAVPAIGWLVTRLFAMTPTSSDALLILACAPGGITAIQFTSKSKEALAFAGQTAFLLTGLSILLSPFLMSIFLPADLALVVPYEKAFWYFFIFLLLPLALGLLIRERAGSLGERLGKPMAFVGTVAFLAFMVLTLSIRQVVMANVDSADVEAMLGFVFASMVAGWLGGGPQRETRQVLASASSMRNVGLCLAIVTRSLPDSGIEIPLVAFCALMIPPNLVLTILMLVLNRFRSKT